MLFRGSVLIFLLFSTFIEQSLTQSQYCLLSGNEPTGTKKLPYIPDNYYTRVEMSDEILKSSSMALEYFDGRSAKSTIEFEYPGGEMFSIRLKAIFDYVANQTVYIQPLNPSENDGKTYECTVKNFTDDVNQKLFGGVSVNGKRIISSKDMFHLGGIPQVYMGQTTARGIDVDHWRSCYNSSDPDYAVNIDFFFARDTWTAAGASLMNVPVRALVQGLRYDSVNNKTEFFKRRYEFIEFSSPLEAGLDRVFEIPRGVFCDGYDRSVRPPQISSKRLRFKTEAVFPGIGMVTAATNYIDDRLNFTQVETSESGKRAQIVIHDFNTGIQYTIDKIYKNCSMEPVPIGQDTSVEYLPNDTYVLRMKRGSELFRLDGEYQYHGQRTIRNIQCDSYVSKRTKWLYENDPKKPIVLDYCFMSEYFTSNPDTGSGSENPNRNNSIPVQVFETTPNNDFQTSIDFFDFDLNPPIMFPDLGWCFPEDRQHFQIRMPGQYGGVIDQPNVLSTFTEVVRLEVAAMADVEVSRVHTEIDYDEDNVYIVGALMGRPPAIKYFTYMAKGWLVGTPTRFTTVKDAAECAAKCLELNGGWIPHCLSFDFCPSSFLHNTCYMNQKHTGEGSLVNSSRNCYHYGKTVDGTIGWGKPLNTAVKSLTNLVYEGAFEIPVLDENGTTTSTYLADSIVFTMDGGNSRDPVMKFTAMRDATLRANALSVVWNSAITTCAQLCLNSTKFQCLSFEFISSSTACRLFDVHPDLGAQTEPNRDSTVYSLDLVHTYEEDRVRHAEPSVGSVTATDPSHCAGRCDGSTGCRGFYYCKDTPNPNDQTKPIRDRCYLREHRYFAQENSNKLPSNSVNAAKRPCQMYLKPPLSDFKRQEKTVYTNVKGYFTMWGSISPAMCAHECYKSSLDDCLSFYHCDDPKLNVQHCVFRPRNIFEPAPLPEIGYSSSFVRADLFKTCFVYDRVYQPGDEQELPTIVGNTSAPGLPKLPESYSVAVEITVKDKSSSHFASEALSGSTNRAMLEYVVDGTVLQYVFDFNNNELFSINVTGKTCETLNMTGNPLGSLFGYQGSDGRFVFTGMLALNFGNGFNETYMGRKTIRNVPCDHWKSVLQTPTGWFIQGVFFVDYYYAIESWQNSFGHPRTPIRITVSGTSTLNGLHRFERIYDLIGFHPYEPPEHYFQIPDGIICTSRNPFKPIPKLADRYSFRAEMTMPDIEFTTTSHAWYDRPLKMTQYVYAKHDNEYHELHDFSTGVAFRRGSQSDGCEVIPMPRDSFSVLYNASMADNGTALVMASPNQAFYLDNRFSYQGTVNCRGMRCDVFKAKVDNYSHPLQQKKIVYTFEMRILDEIGAETPSDGESIDTRIPFELRINADDKSYSMIYNYYDFNENPQPFFWNYDDCFLKSDDRRRLQIRFTGDYVDAVQNSFIRNRMLDFFRTSILNLTTEQSYKVKAGAARLQNIQLTHDTSNVYILFSLVPPVGYLERFTVLRNMRLRISSGHIVGWGASPEECAKSCLTYSNFECKSFDYCGWSSRKYCYLNRLYTWDKPDLTQPYFLCDHYSRTSEYRYVQESSNDEILFALINKIYSKRMKIDVPLLDTTTNQFMLKSYVADQLKDVTEAFGGTDERDLLTTSFERYPNRMGARAGAIRLNGVSLTECGQRCINEKTILCRGFDYSAASAVCELFSLAIPMISSSEYDFYSRNELLFFHKLPGYTLPSRGIRIEQSTTSSAACAQSCLKNEKPMCRSFDYCNELDDYFVLRSRQNVSVNGFIVYDEVSISDCPRVCHFHNGGQLCGSFYYCNGFRRCAFLTDRVHVTKHSHVINETLACDFYVSPSLYFTSTPSPANFQELLLQRADLADTYLSDNDKAPSSSGNYETLSSNSGNDQSEAGSSFVMALVMLIVGTLLGIIGMLIVIKVCAPRLLDHRKPQQLITMTSLDNQE